MKKIVLYVICALSAIFFVSCDAGSILLGSSTVNISVKPLINSEALQVSSSRAVLSFTEQTITVTAQADGMSSVTQTLLFDAEAGLFSGSVKVAKGKEVTFSVEAKDTAGTVYVKGSQTKLIENDADKVSILLAPVVADTDAKEESPVFIADFTSLEKGTVKTAVFAPITTLDLKYTYTAQDVSVTVSDKAGKVLFDDKKEWTMKSGDEAVVLFTKTGDNPVLLVHPQYITITFDANEGTGTMEKQAVIPGLEAKLTKNSFERAGYAFAGWNTEKDGKGTAYKNEEAVTLTENTTLYAQWAAYTLTVDIAIDDGGNVTVNGGTALSSVPFDGTLSVTVTTDKTIEECKWILFFRVLDSTTTSVMINLTDHSDIISLGTNALTFTYKINGSWYSKVILFTVVEGTVNK